MVVLEVILGVVAVSLEAKFDLPDPIRGRGSSWPVAAAASQSSKRCQVSRETDLGSLTSLDVLGTSTALSRASLASGDGIVAKGGQDARMGNTAEYVGPHAKSQEITPCRVHTQQSVAG